MILAHGASNFRGRITWLDFLTRIEFNEKANGIGNFSAHGRGLLLWLSIGLTANFHDHDGVVVQSD